MRGKRGLNLCPLSASKGVLLSETPPIFPATVHILLLHVSHFLRPKLCRSPNHLSTCLIYVYQHVHPITKQPSLLLCFLFFLDYPLIFLSLTGLSNSRVLFLYLPLSSFLFFQYSFKLLLPAILSFSPVLSWPSTFASLPSLSSSAPPPFLPFTQFFSFLTANVSK